MAFCLDQEQLNTCCKRFQMISLHIESIAMHVDSQKKKKKHFKNEWA
jgi:hypothetical protein